MDATVTDGQGNPVPDLNAADFRVLLDGKPQTIRYCDFVRPDGAPARMAASSPSAGPLTAPLARPEAEVSGQTPDSVLEAVATRVVPPR